MWAEPRRAIRYQGELDRPPGSCLLERIATVRTYRMQADTRRCAYTSAAEDMKNTAPCCMRGQPRDYHIEVKGVCPECQVTDMHV